LLRRLSNKPPESVRTMGAIQLRFIVGAELEIAATKEAGNFAVLECHDTSLIETFVVLCLDMIRSLGDGSLVGRAVQDRLAEWRELLTGEVSMSADEQLGLWGELQVLSRFPNLQAAVDGWHGPNREAIDFSRNSIGIEVKTSKQRRIHVLRWTQAVFGGTAHATYLASLHAISDPTGASIPDLVRDLLERVPDPYLLREKLLSAKYRHEHADRYESRFTLVEEPSFFAMSDVPRIIDVPAGVLDLRWRVDLAAKRSLSDAGAKTLLNAFSE
jgi:hypothetical protein